MALDVWLNNVGELPFIELAHTMELVLSFDYEPNWLFLEPYFEQISDDCPRIDLYDFVALHGPCLDRLVETLLQARSAANLLPAQWDQHMGTRMSDPPEELFELGDKNTLLGVIDTLLENAHRARVDGKQLLFFGD